MLGTRITSRFAKLLKDQILDALFDDIVGANVLKSFFVFQSNFLGDRLKVLVHLQEGVQRQQISLTAQACVLLLLGFKSDFLPRTKSLNIHFPQIVCCDSITLKVDKSDQHTRIRLGHSRQHLLKGNLQLISPEVDG